MLASAPLLPKSVSEGAAMYHELRKRGTSAADLKFLHRLRQTHFRNFKSKSGTRIINLLVPLCFRSSCQRVPRCITNFGSGALAAVKTLSTLLLSSGDLIADRRFAWARDCEEKGNLQGAAELLAQALE